MTFIRQGFRKLSSERQTDRQNQPKLYKMLSYRRETALQGVL